MPTITKPHPDNAKPSTMRANCLSLKCDGKPRLHRCVLVGMSGRDNNIVKTTCLTCGKEITR